MPEENIGPAPRSTTQCDGGVGGGGAQRLADGEHELAVEGVALLGAVEHDVADRAVLFGDDEGHCRERTRGSAPSHVAAYPHRPRPHRAARRARGRSTAPPRPSPRPSAAPSRPPRSTRPCRGTWLGHPLHPLLTDLPIGTWTSAVAARLARRRGRRDGRRPADRRSGSPSAVPTVATGYADWADTEAGQRRACAAIGHRPRRAPTAPPTALFGASLAARARRRARRRQAARARRALGALGAGGYLGGHLTYAEGVGVDTTAFEDYPEDWTQALADAALGEGEMQRGRGRRRRRPDRAPRRRVYALADRCAHRGGSLDEGELVRRLRQVPAARQRLPARRRLRRARPGRLPAAGAGGARARRLDRGARPASR